MTHLRGDTGSVTTETVIVTPIAIVLLCLVAFVGRAGSARGQVDEAARDAARAASLERDAGSALQAAQLTAATALAGNGRACAATDVDVDTSAFRPGGHVAVTVRCDIALSDLGLLGLSGTKTVSSTRVSVVDQYRGIR